MADKNQVSASQVSNVSPVMAVPPVLLPAMTTPVAASKPTANDMAWAGTPKRWLVNASLFNPSLPVDAFIRINEKIDDSRAIALVSSPACLREYNQRKGSSGLAINADGKWTTIPLPSGQLKLNGATGGARGQDVSLQAITSQACEMLARAITLEAHVKPMHNGAVSAVEVAGNVGTFTVTCGDGTKYTVSIAPKQ